ncbi:MAG TPA: hypothetical protein VFJ43_06470, partial [Bacteroidia bacterium]|nr:hypothetical protein [Bacteroidia bacterium]
WLKGMIPSGNKPGKDLMSAFKTTQLSASQGIRTVSNDPKDKDYRKAQLEVRGGPTIRASEWVSYVEKVFMAARGRTGDTPDDISTTKNEASRTGLKK